MSVELKNKIIKELTAFQYSSNPSHMILWCPFCDDRESNNHAHLYFSKENMKWKCFNCQRAGNRPFSLLEAYDIHIDYYDYLDLHLKDISMPRASERVKATDSTELKEFANECVPIQRGSEAWEYLKNRLISDYDIEFSWRLWDKFPEYVFWVYYDLEYKPRYYIGRNYKNPKTKKKYMNAKNLTVPFVVFHPNDPMYVARKQKDALFLVEGVFDAYNIPFSAVPLFTKNINNMLLKDIKDYCFSNNAFPVIAVDLDAVGEMYKIADKLFDEGINTIGLFLFDKGEKDFGEGKFKFANHKELVARIKFYNPYVKI